MNGTLVGIYKDSPSVVKFFPVPAKEGPSGLYELHRYPVQGTDEHTLALVGAESLGLLDLADVINPAATTFPKGTKCDWNSFSLNKETKTIDYAGAAGGRWVAFPSGTNGEWSVKWKSSKCAPVLFSLSFSLLSFPIPLSFSTTYSIRCML